MSPAERHRHERRARLLRMRRTVAAVSLAVFIAVFSTIYVQMASGHDPALGKAAKQTSETRTLSSTPVTTSQS
jgi:hypothetical protein